MAASEWLGMMRGWLVSGVRAAEWTGGEPEVAEQLLHLPGRWTLLVPAFNMPRRPKAEMGLGLGFKKF